MVVAVMGRAHPSVEALYTVLLPEEWEGLAVASSEGIATRPASSSIDNRLKGLGLITQNRLPTAAGYALLFAWHRRNPPRSSRWWSAISREQRRHEDRMHLLIDVGPAVDQVLG